MPGRHLNDEERALLKLWEEPVSKYPILTGISVKGDPGLRGIKNLDIDFRYPITVICGKNGAGKTTVLALCALAFHPPKGHRSHQARNSFKKGYDRSYYTFSDFFFKGTQDPDISGVGIEWRFKNWHHPHKHITKQTEKWMKYPSRPERPVHYVGVSRVVPAVELPVLRNYFKSSAGRVKTQSLNDFFRQKLSAILERSYQHVGELTSGRYSLPVCNYRSPYTGFNMGAGEDTLIDLLYLLQETPNGSLVVIEEIELGLHPSAQARLAQELVNIALHKQLQFVVSSHSGDFIDNLPSLARIVLNATPDGHEVMYECTTRFALSHISGTSHYELRIYCEDRFAASLIAHLLPGPVRERVLIIPVGDKAEVARQCIGHLKGKYEGKCLAVFDGDVKEKEILKWFSKGLKDNDRPHPDYLILPGGDKPEKWVLATLLNNQDYLEKLAHLLRYEMHIEQLKVYLNEVSALADYHDVTYELKRRTTLDQDLIENYLVASVCQAEELRFIRNRIELVLEDQEATVPGCEVNCTTSACVT